MSDLRKKLEALVEREAATYYVNLTWGDRGISIEDAQQRKQGFYRGAHLLLDALDDQHDHLDPDIEYGNCKACMALSSLEKRLSVNTEKRGEEE